MKKHLYILVACLIIGWPAFPAFAAGSHNTHDTKETMDHNTQNTDDHAGHIGEKIHESEVEGHRLAYHLLDLPGREAKHLITYIIDPEGNPVKNAKVGYLVVGPDGKQQKVMAMAMEDSFGGDVDFSAKGQYTIKAKAVFGNENLLDSFSYAVE